MENGKLKIILSGGGTGGHIYPSVAVAEALRRELGDGVELLFVGAEGKMEMEKLPALGYRVVGLPVAGLQRKLDLRNFALPFKVMKSIREARRTIRAFGADAAAGFGGYASAPVLWAAQHMGIPTLIQEQNSYAGVTNTLAPGRPHLRRLRRDGAFLPCRPYPLHRQSAPGGLRQGRTAGGSRSPFRAETRHPHDTDSGRQPRHTHA